MALAQNALEASCLKRGTDWPGLAPAVPALIHITKRELRVRKALAVPAPCFRRGPIRHSGCG